MPPLSIPARTFRLIPAKSYDGKITQAIPPPPSYHASVRNAIHRNEINQITTQIQQSCSTNLFNVSASSSSTVTTNINAINASGSSAVYVNPNPMKQLAANETDTIEPMNQIHTDEISTADEYENLNDNSSNTSTSTNNSSRVDLDNNELDRGNDTSNGKLAKFNEHTTQRFESYKDATTVATVANDLTPCESTSTSNEMRRSFKQELVDTQSTTDTENANDKRARGLKVLSNVQVSPNAILNVSTISTNNETIPLNNMIIVSSIPSTSTGTTSQALSLASPSASTLTSTTSTSSSSSLSSTQLTKLQSLLKMTSDTRKTKHTRVNVEVSVIFDCPYSYIHKPNNVI